MLVAAIYGTFAVAAFYATCRDEFLRWVGLWLLGGYIVSNLLFFGHMPPAERVGPYTAIEVIVAVASAWAIFDGDRSKWLSAIIAFNLLSIAANIGLAVNFPANPRQIYLWNVTTNMCFAAECLFALGIGVAHGLRVGRFSRWFFIRGDSVASRASQGDEA